MTKLTLKKQEFDIKASVECGQLFRYRPYKDGYLLISADNAAYLHCEGDDAVIECDNGGYFENFFDLSLDVEKIAREAMRYDIEVLNAAVSLGKGIRLFKADKEEAIMSFIISANNNIKRIQGIIERICSALGEKKRFMGEEFYSFPTMQALASKGADFYAKLGAGYRARYIAETAKRLAISESAFDFDTLSTEELKKQLLTLMGVGEKVANCITLFGYARRDSFPVDTWIRKIYLEDFSGEPMNDKQITKFFLDKFGLNSGYVQQYLFYYKRENSMSKD